MFSFVFDQKSKVIDFDHFLNSDLINHLYNLGHYIRHASVVKDMSYIKSYFVYRYLGNLNLSHILYDLKIIGQFINDGSPCIFLLYR